MDKRNRRAGGGEGHLPASEADSDLIEEGTDAEQDVSLPASEAEDERLRDETEDEAGRPGAGRPGSFPPPD
jgi:hypothetical protein